MLKTFCRVTTLTSRWLWLLNSGTVNMEREKKGTEAVFFPSKKKPLWALLLHYKAAHLLVLRSTPHYSPSQENNLQQERNIIYVLLIEGLNKIGFRSITILSDCSLILSILKPCKPKVEKSLFAWLPVFRV